MSGTDTLPVTETTPEESDQPADVRQFDGPRPLVVFAAAFGVLYTLLVLRNGWLFSTVVDEGGDFAANSIITYQAKHFDLLVGNYSRLHFSHPGPSFFYVQAFGEWLFYDLLRVVPSPWNAHALIILALNSALVAMTLAVLSRWVRSWPVVGVAAAVMVVYFAVNGNLVADIWMPFMYFPPFLLLLTAAASVAAGRTKDLWALVLAGGFLVHGHAAFLLFVPVIAVMALVMLVYHHRGSRLAALRKYPRDWLLMAGVVGLFLLPIVIKLALHWPGEFGKYLSYGQSDIAGGHSVTEAVTFAMRFWPGRDGHLWPGQPGPPMPGHRVAPLYIALALFGGVVALAWWQRKQAIGRFLLAAAALAALATGLLIVYAVRGIDDLSEEYTGWFSHAVPLLLVVLVAIGLAEPLRRSRWAVHRAIGPVLVSVMVMATLMAAAASTTLRTPAGHITNIPYAIDVIRSRTGGNPALLETQHDAWATMTALVIAGHRNGQRICVVDPFWTFMVTSEFVCDERDLRSGTRFLLSVPGSTPSGVVVLADFRVPDGPGPQVTSAVLSTPAG